MNFAQMLMRPVTSLEDRHITDGWPEADEDSAYDIARQRRLDEEDFAARQKEWNDENN